MKRFLKIFVAILVLLALLTTVVLVFAYCFISPKVNYTLDEELFANSSKPHFTEYTAFKDDGKAFTVLASKNNSRWINIECIPDAMLDTFVAVEDRKFYDHHGVDVKRTAYAFLNYVFDFKNNFGGSTITQQVIKNISGDNERSFERKLTELFRAFHLELAHTKEEIIEMYLNVIPFGADIYGISSASLAYFDKEVGELELDEIATLVGVANAPSRYNPIKHYEECMEKRNRILYVMKDQGVISEDDYSKLLGRKTEIAQNKRDEDIFAAFITVAEKEIIDDLRREYKVSCSAAELILSSGKKVLLSVDPDIQYRINTYFKKENLPLATKDGLDYSVAVFDNESGRLVGVMGGIGFSKQRTMNTAMITRPPASTIKPLTLYAPLIENDEVNWATEFSDEPIEAKDGRVYPKNSPDKYDGRISLKDALRLSKNTVAVQLYRLRSGRDVFHSLKNDFGFTSLVESYEKDGSRLSDIAEAPLALGQLTKGVNIIELTRAYTVFPRNGVVGKSNSYYAVFDSNGEKILENNFPPKRVFSHSTAQIMCKMLQTVVEDGTASNVNIKEYIDTAGKTGTSSGDKDRLFVGFTPYYTLGIWCGYLKNDKAVGKQEISHLQIWDELMLEIHEELIFSSKREPKNFPSEDIVRLPIKREQCLIDEDYEFGFFKK